MSFIFRGSRGDIEDGFSSFVPERNPLRIQHVRSVNTSSLAFLVTVLLLFTILNTHQMSPNFLLWLVLGVFFIATSLRMYATCQQLQAQAQAHAAAGSGLLGPAQFHLQIPASVTSRGRLQGLRLQLAVLDRELDDLDYETLRALDSDHVTDTPSINEAEIDALPVHKYKMTGRESGDLTQEEASSSSSTPKEKENTSSAAGSGGDLTCTICLEQVKRGDLLRTLPCLHQFHTHCIDPWLRQRGTCPVCKLRIVGSEMQDNLDNVVADVVDMV